MPKIKRQPVTETLAELTYCMDCSLTKFLEYLEEFVKKGEEAGFTRDNMCIQTDDEYDYDGTRRNVVLLQGSRPETIAEAKDRLTKAKEKKEAVAERERQEYLRLKDKFEKGR